MSTDARTFHAVHFFGGMSEASVREADLSGGYMAMASKYAEKCAQVDRLRAELARVNDKAQRVLERLS